MEASVLSWHLTNRRDTGRITARDWNRSLGVLAIVNSAGWQIARFLSDTAVHHAIQSVFLIFHQSELPRTASDNWQQILAQRHRTLPATVFIFTIGARRKEWQPCFFFRQILGMRVSLIYGDESAVFTSQLQVGFSVWNTKVECSSPNIDHKYQDRMMLIIKSSSGFKYTYFFIFYLCQGYVTAGKRVCVCSQLWTD